MERMLMRLAVIYRLKEKGVTTLSKKRAIRLLPVPPLPSILFACEIR
jgi:hypothetical protein